jgi:hypothetical protein
MPFSSETSAAARAAREEQSKQRRVRQAHQTHVARQALDHAQDQTKSQSRSQSRSRSHSRSPSHSPSHSPSPCQRRHRQSSLRERFVVCASACTSMCLAWFTWLKHIFGSFCIGDTVLPLPLYLACTHVKLPWFERVGVWLGCVEPGDAWARALQRAKIGGLQICPKATPGRPCNSTCGSEHRIHGDVDRIIVIDKNHLNSVDLQHFHGEAVTRAASVVDIDPTEVARSHLPGSTVHIAASETVVIVAAPNMVGHATIVFHSTQLATAKEAMARATAWGASNTCPPPPPVPLRNEGMPPSCSHFQFNVLTPTRIARTSRSVSRPRCETVDLWQQSIGELSGVLCWLPV